MGKNLVIGSLHRPPKTSCVEFVHDYKKLTNHLKNENSNLILGMGHNSDLLKASVHNSTQCLLEVNLDNSLYPCITKPMRLTNNSVTLIDNVFIDCNLLGKHLSKIKVDNFNDHFPSIVIPEHLVPQTKEPIKILSRGMRDCTFEKIKSELSGITWSNVITENVNSSFDEFHDIVCGVIEKHSPVRSKTVSVKFWKAVFDTSGIQKRISKLKLLYKNTIIKGANQAEIVKYSEYRNLLNKMKHLAKKDYYATKCF